MPSQDLIILIVQIIAALGVVVSVVYLGLQIKQQNIITKAQLATLLPKDYMKGIFKPLLIKNMQNLWLKIGMLTI